MSLDDACTFSAKQGSMQRSTMDETTQSFDALAAISEISALLSRSSQSEFVQSPLENRDQVILLKTADFATFVDFKETYLSCRQPVLCFVDRQEVPELVSFLRESDDIALSDEADEIVEWRIARIAIAHAKRLDPLTQVHRRDQLIQSLKPICRAADSCQPASLILLDIDHLKMLNDRLGVRVGDRILAKLARLVQTLCQKTVVARTRGGEFGILVNGDEKTAQKVASAIHESIDAHQWCEGANVTVSFGVSSVRECCEPGKLLTMADEALFAAKANGRNKVVCYSEIAAVSNCHHDEIDVISMENKARVLGERVTSFVTQQSNRIMKSLRHEANTDGLTQLFNRRYLDKQLAEDFGEAIANEKDLCIALIDLDHFGEVNKEHGWPTGDKILCAVATGIVQTIRGSDWVGRYGGEEICIVMPATRLDHAITVCERIRSSIESMPLESTAEAPIAVTLSIGVVELDPQTDKTPEAMIERVSQQTLKAKMEGRNRVIG